MLGHTQVQTTARYAHLARNTSEGIGRAHRRQHRPRLGGIAEPATGAAACPTAGTSVLSEPDTLLWTQHPSISYKGSYIAS